MVTRSMASLGHRGRSRRRRIRAGFTLALAASLSLSPLLAHPAWAADDAARLVEEATRAFNAGNYPAAVESFKAALAADPHPAIAFNLGRSYELLNRIPEALAQFRAVIAMNPGRAIRDAATAKVSELVGVLTEQGYDPITVTAEEYVPRGSMEVVTEPAGANVYVDGRFVGVTPQSVMRIDAGTHNVRIALDGYHPVTEVVRVSARSLTPLRHTLQPRTSLEEYRAVAPGTLSVVAPGRGMTVTLDGDRVGTTPLDALRLAPGSYEVEISGAGWRPFRAEVEIRSGEDTQVSVQTSRIEAEPEAERVDHTTLSWSLMGAGGGLFATGGLVGVLALASERDYQDNRSATDRPDAKASAESRAVAADVLMGLGLAAAASGAVLWYLDHRSASETSTGEGLVLLPLLDGDRAGLGLDLRF
jgi:hypothetical protein